MTDQPGRPNEERLPAPVPEEPRVPAPADRFTAPPAVHRTELSPERVAAIVRQSASSRWVGFLVVTVVALFVIVYYFYELGLPGGLTTPRLVAEAEQQQVVSVERGYNVYRANCARCHGVDGEGGIGPVLHRQDKLYAHLSPEYLENILLVGGRYACGNANSQMPIWSDQGNPPGPLNYRQIQELISFIRAEKGREYEVRDPDLNEPVLGPDGEPLTFEGWVDPNYRPEPGATPFPDCWLNEFATPSPSGSVAPSASPSGPVLELVASGVAFDPTELSAPPDTPFTIHFDNQDAGTQHDVDVLDPAQGTTVFQGDIITGPETIDYQVGALPAGEYQFICTIHPTIMTGTLSVER